MVRNVFLCSLGKGLPLEALLSSGANCVTKGELFDVLGFATRLKACSLLQKELGQKDRLLQQHQAKLEEALRKLSEASYQQVGPYSATVVPALLA